MKSNKYYAVLFLFITCCVNAQVDWPFEDENVQATVVGSIRDQDQLLCLSKNSG